ncbi:MAG: RNA polymerase sporulation sigma factor SigK [Clostridia bacterium]|nr:RNA polymerase sporulation sigma factor SigK [Clostridia bacterium]
MFFSFIIEIISKFFGLFGYISNDKLYPEPLSKTEEEYYLRKYFEGDKNARDVLIEHNLRLVVHIAKKYTANEQELEDYTSIGTIGLIKAIDSFKDNKGFKISTYASRCIENEILMHIRSSKKQKAEVSMHQVIGTDKDGNDMELIDTLVLQEKDTIEDIYDKTILNQVLEFINNNLNKREKYIMNRRYGLDGKKSKTQQELADELGISRSYVSRIETKVQKMLKKNIKE